MHSNRIGCPKIFPPSAPVLYWLSHLTCISSLKAKNERKTLIFKKLKIFRYKQHFFAIFLRRILINWPHTYFLQRNTESDIYMGVCEVLNTVLNIFSLFYFFIVANFQALTRSDVLSIFFMLHGKMLKDRIPGFLSLKRHHFFLQEFKIPVFLMHP